MKTAIVIRHLDLECLGTLEPLPAQALFTRRIDDIRAEPPRGRL